MTSARRIAVIGGGITGLAAAHRVVSCDPDAQVTLFEASDHLGGMIRTESADGYLLELGPDAFITNKPGGVQLCEELGFSEQLIPTDNTFRRSLVLRKGRPLPVPEGFMLMAPAKPWAIATTPVLSIAGKIRLLREFFVRRKQDDDDESLADFVRRRFGRETLDRLVQPLVGGIYTSDPEKLSLRATLPRFLDMERKFGSVIRGTLAQAGAKQGHPNPNAGSGARYGLFATPNRGLSSLVAAIDDKLREFGRVTVHTATRIVALNKSNTSTTDRETPTWNVETASGETSSFDSVIVTLPTYHVATLLDADNFRDLRNSLNTIEYASSAVMLSGHRLSDFTHPLDAFGLVVPAIEDRNVLAISFTSRKFPGRAPDGHVLLRTFVGGAMQPELLEQSDQQITESVNAELTAILGMQRPPELCRLVRYHRGMPQYHVGHLDRISRIEHLVGQHRGLYLAGSAYHGVGIPDSISSGRAAAEAALDLEANRASCSPENR